VTGPAALVELAVLRNLLVPRASPCWTGGTGRDRVSAHPRRLAVICVIVDPAIQASGRRPATRL